MTVPATETTSGGDLDTRAAAEATPPATTRLHATSAIHHVTVYPRGAVVRRRVTLPPAGELPDGAFELVLGGLPVSADASSLRVHALGDRRVVGTHTRVALSPSSAETDTTAAQTPALRAQRDELLRDQRALELRAEAAKRARQRAREAQQFARENDKKRGLRHGDDPRMLVAHGEAMARVLDAFARDAESERHEVERLLTEVRRKRTALEMIASSRPTLDADPKGPTVELRVELGPRAGDTPLTLEVEYVVRAARYWPAYTVRFSSRSQQATLGFDPFVVQLTGEDWVDATLSIATGDLHTDATLPKLPSWRLGRAQQVKQLGYRALPDDSRRLFDDFEAAWARVEAARPAMREPKAPGPVPPPPPSGPPPATGMYGAPMPAPAGAAPPGSFGVPAMLESAELAAAVPMMAAPSRGGPMPKKAGGPFGGLGGGGAPPPPSVARARASVGAAPEPVPQEAEPEPVHRPSDEALDFDRLVLASPRSSQRGRLVIASGEGPSSSATPSSTSTSPPISGASATTIHHLAAPARAVDPSAAGLVFDHLFHGSGTVHVPSSPEPQRVLVGRRTATTTPRLAVVPRETSDVFREADLDNPFDGPLLPGPLDVLQDGSLLAETTLALVDRGGRARVGMGVEDRVKVARNVRVEEKSAGLLGGSRAVDHNITIDIVSSLPFATSIEVRDRIPFAEEDAGVEVKLGAAHPSPNARDTSGGLPGTLATANESAIVRGALVWHLPLSAGAASSIKFSYRLTFSSKDEILGGNRRD